MSNTAPVRVRLRYADLETFVDRFAPNVTRGGIFLASRTPRPVGETFRFAVQLASGQVALSGQGKVIWVKEFNPDEPQKPHGMGVQFVSIDAGSRETLNRMLKIKAAPRPGGAPRSPTGPVGVLHGATNGTARQRIDTSVDLASEYGLDEAALRRSVERHRLPVARAIDEELDDLLKPEPLEPPTLAQALSELPPPRSQRPPPHRRLPPPGPLPLADKPAAAAASEPAPRTEPNDEEPS